MGTIKEHNITTDMDHSRDSGSTGFPLPDGAWTVQQQDSEIGFAVKEMWGLRTVRGVFGAFDGDLRIRDGVVTGELTVQADSLDTANKRRDEHLRSATFFDVEHHPQIRFDVKAVTTHDEGLTVTGSLDVGSSRTRLEIPVAVEQADGGALRLEGTTTVSRAAAGLGWNVLGMIRGDAVVHVQLALSTS